MDLQLQQALDQALNDELLSCISTIYIDPDEFRAHLIWRVYDYFVRTQHPSVRQATADVFGLTPRQIYNILRQFHYPPYHHSR